ALDAPGITVAMIDETVVQPEGAVLPEFDEARLDPEARPVRRPRHAAYAVLGGHLGDPLLERKAAFQRSRLFRGPGADLALARPARKVGVGLWRRDRRHRALDADLAAQRLPVEQQRSQWMRQDLPALAALVVGEEDEAARVVALEQHHARRRHAVLADRGQRHGFRIVRLLAPGLPEPFLEQDQRVGWRRIEHASPLGCGRQWPGGDGRSNVVRPALPVQPGDCPARRSSCPLIGGSGSPSLGADLARCDIVATYPVAAGVTAPCAVARAT